MTARAMAHRVAAAAYRWRWPVGWWRLRGQATVKLGGHQFVFTDVAGSVAEWWALEARRQRWEQPVVAAFAAAVRPGDVVYDVGAWVGAYALLAARLTGPEGQVFTFEPDPVARAQLERNIAANGLTNITVVPVALAAEAGSARLSGGGSEARVGAEGDIEVQTTTLRTFVDGHPAPDLIKVDIEGGELGLDRDVLRDARDLFLEIHAPVFRTAGQDPQAFLEDLAAGRPVTRLEGDGDNFNVRIP